PAISARQSPGGQAEIAADQGKVLLDMLESDDAIHGDLAFDGDPVDLRAHPVQFRADFAAPGRWRVNPRLAERGFDPVRKVPPFALRRQEEQPGGARPAFLLLVVIIREDAVPRVSYNGELIVMVEQLGWQFSRVTPEVLVILPVDPEYPIHAVARVLRDMH